jgi:hypothetical protein
MAESIKYNNPTPSIKYHNTENSKPNQINSLLKNANKQGKAAISEKHKINIMAALAFIFILEN